MAAERSGGEKPGKSAKDVRSERLAAELRANLKRRKAASRAWTAPDRAEPESGNGEN